VAKRILEGHHSQKFEKKEGVNRCLLLHLEEETDF